MNRRQFLIAGAVAAACRGLRAAPAASTTTDAPADDGVENIAWHNVQDWGIEGRGFDDTEAYFDRLPKRAAGVVRDAVWNLSRDTSGMSVRFATDAEAIHVRYTLLKPNLAMPHMPATGVSGIDLYGQGTGGTWHYVRTLSPTQQSMSKLLQDGLVAGERRYQIYLPLYNGVRSLEIGVPEDARFQGISPRTQKPILFYGTSITQGGCASRPGMSFTNILGRRLDVPMLNFGFSGNGRMELEVARFLAELDPAAFVIDCSANCTPEIIAERAAPLVTLLRGAHGNMPILLVDERLHTNAPLLPSVESNHAAKSAALRSVFEDLQQAGVEHLHYRDDAGLLGDDGEATVDGSHPTDLGMLRYADALEADLRALLRA